MDSNIKTVVKARPLIQRTEGESRQNGTAMVNKGQRNYSNRWPKKPHWTILQLR